MTGWARTRMENADIQSCKLIGKVSGFLVLAGVLLICLPFHLFFIDLWRPLRAAHGGGLLQKPFSAVQSRLLLARP
jgi:hypothetical protein